MKARPFCVIGNFDFRIRQLTQFFNCLYIGRPHIRSRDDAQFSASRGEIAQFIDDEAQPAPLDERNEHIDTVC
ncbi:hypothetical protein SDC9_66244 [bioreactor metagenome]|uniref:Uncharacterized protein n=1 Tax=bioreactor metagenome TaxID=1076179 RepID=A0A644XVL9_9ZZZZ